MPSPFAALEARTNAAVLRRLGNAQAAVVAGGAPFTVIFEEEYVSPLGIGAVQPAAVTDGMVARLLPTSAEICIDALASAGEIPRPDAPRYLVIASEPTDGLVRLLLERVL